MSAPLWKNFERTLGTRVRIVEKSVNRGAYRKSITSPRTISIASMS
jgi:hypothetical protein